MEYRWLGRTGEGTVKGERKQPSLFGFAASRDRKYLKTWFEIFSPPISADWHIFVLDNRQNGF